MEGEDADEQLDDLRLPDSFFDGMQEIRVLSMEEIRINSLPPSTKLLKNLTTLHLYYCRSLETISVVGELLKLEIFSCYYCPNIRALPIEIGRLNRLRLLEIIHFKNLTRIVPGVISNLISLEELKLRSSFRRWEAKQSNKKENAALAELESLTKLTCLEIEIDDVSLAAEEICLPSGIVKYGISIPTGRFQSLRAYPKAIYIEIPKEMNVGNWIKTLVRSTECLDLNGDGAIQLVNLVEHEKRKFLALQSCSLVKLINTTTGTISTSVFPLLETLRLHNLDNLEEIIPVGYCYTDYYSCFKNLKRITIDGCPRLQHLFPMRVAIRCLAQLEDLEVEDCEAIEDIFCDDHDKMEKDGKFSSHNLRRALPKLNCLALRRLPRLKAQETFNKIAAPLNLENLRLEGLKDDAIRSMWCLRSSFGNLVNLTISDFHGIKKLMSPAIARNLVQLRRLEVKSCEMMLAVIVDDDDDDDDDSYFRNLRRIGISNCRHLQYLFPMRVAIRCLAQLEYLDVEDCEAIEDIFRDDQMEKDGEFSSHNLPRALPKLNVLYLRRLPRLKAQETLNKIAASLNLKSLCLEGLKDDVISSTWCLCISFGNLQYLTISDFNGIKELMSPAIARNLVQLRSLVVKSCQMMLAVIADDDNGVQEVMGQISLFPRLGYIYMRSLPNMRSFCQWKHHNTLELPSLREVYIDNCPLVETFSHGSLSTPKLETVHLNDKSFETKDLNKEIQQCRSEQMHGSSMEIEA